MNCLIGKVLQLPNLMYNKLVLRDKNQGLQLHYWKAVWLEWVISAAMLKRKEATDQLHVEDYVKATDQTRFASDICLNDSSSQMY